MTFEQLEDRLAPAVAGQVWHDLDSDGVRDAGEPGIAGAAVELFRSTNSSTGDLDDVSLGVQVTDANGNYAFAAAPENVNLFLTFRPTVGNPVPSFGFAALNVGADDAVDSDADPAHGRTAIFTLSTLAPTATLDCGLQGQTPAFGWALQIDANDINGERAEAVVLDQDGNLYVTGHYGGTADFDPGPGTYLLTSVASDDVFVAKYTPAGSLLWARGFGGTLGDDGKALAVDAAGNVYVSGRFQGTVDFDPGSGTFNLTAVASAQGFVSKFDANGNFLWAAVQGLRIEGLAVDAAGNVYTTGFFGGGFGATYDFDPGAGVFNLTSVDSTEDVFISKLTSSGNFVWARQLGGPGSPEKGLDIAVDPAGNVWTIGHFAGTSDFDPGAGEFYLTANGSQDVFVSKLTSAGNFAWAGSWGGSGINSGEAIAVDAQGNVYAAGTFSGSMDADPGSGTVILSNVGAATFVTKLDNAGGFLWAQLLPGSGSGNTTDLALDAAGNAYVCGRFVGTVDFKPGTGTFNLTDGGGGKGYLWILSAQGAFITAFAQQGSTSSKATGVAVDDQGVYLVGEFDGLIDFDPHATSFALDTNGDSNSFVTKIETETQVTGRVWHDLDGDGTREAGEPGIAGAVAELFSDLDGTPGNADDVSHGTAVTDLLGFYSFPGSFPAGIKYYVAFRPPVGNPPQTLTFAPANAGDEASDSDADPATGRSVSSVLVGLQSLDAGLMGTAPGFGWAARAGAAGDDTGHSIAADADGNVYVTGKFSGTVDFDSGPASVSLVSVGGTDVFVAKYSSTGALVWARAMGGASFDDGGTGIAVDAAGNVFVSGLFRNTVDFDPSTATFNLTGIGLGTNTFLLKLDSQGAFVWVKGYAVSQSDRGNPVAVDAAGNVLLLGSFQGTVDFNPGPATLNLTSGGDFDAYVTKLANDGTFLWAKRLGGVRSDNGSAVAADNQGNIYLTGSFNTDGDFDPDPSTVFTLTSPLGTFAAFVTKLDSAGNFVWAKRIGDNSSGNGLALDANANVHIVGDFNGMSDFDPGEGPGQTFVLTPNNIDTFVSKLDSAGNFIWARRLGGSASEYGWAVAVDGAGNVLTTGQFTGGTDFNPDESPGAVHQLNGAGGQDVFVSRLNSAGSFVSVQIWGADSSDIAYGIAADRAGNVYTTGFFANTVDFDPAAGTSYNLTSPGSGMRDIFVSLLADQTPPQVLSVTPSVSTVSKNAVGGTFTLTIVYSEAMNTAIAPTLTFPVENPAATLTFTGGSWLNGTTYVASYSVADANTTLPNIDVQVAGGRDLKANPQAVDTRTNLFSIDTQRPTAVSVTPNTALLTDASVGPNAFTLTIVYGEPMAADAPVITFPSGNPAGALVLSSGTWSNATTYVATYSVVDTDLTLANIDVRVTGARDLTGNLQTQGDGTSLFSIDTQNPTVTSLTPSSALLNSAAVGTPFTLTVVFSESMNTTILPTLTFPVENPAGTLTLTEGAWSNATTYVATYAVADIDMTLTNIDVRVTGAKDLVGNLQAQSDRTNIFSIDTQNPGVASVTPAPSMLNSAAVGSPFRLTVTFSEAMNTGIQPTITFPVENPGATLALAGSSWSNATTFVATYMVFDVNMTVANIDVRVTGARDAADNLQTPSDRTNIFSIDTLNPSVMSLTPSAVLLNSAAVGTPFSLTVVFSESMNTTIQPTLSFPVENPAGALTLTGGTWSNATTYVATYAVDDTDLTLANIDVRVTGARDLAGNVQTQSDPTNVFSIDTQTPLLSSIASSVSMLSGSSVGAPFTLTLTFNEAMNTALEPVISFPEDDLSATLTFAQGSWTNAQTYVATFNVADANAFYLGVAVRASSARDVAGNVQAPTDFSNVFTVAMGPSLVTGSGAGRASSVQVFSTDGDLQFGFQPYPASFVGGVTVAVGDVTGDGRADIVTAPGKGLVGSTVKVFDGLSGNLLASFTPFAATFKNGVNLAVGNFDGDAALEIVCAQAVGGQVRIYNVAAGAGTLLPGLLGKFSPFGSTYVSGLVVAAGNYDGVGIDEVISAKAKGAAKVRIDALVGTKRVALLNVAPFPATFKGGSFLAAGDINGDGKDDILVSPGAGVGGPAVKVYSGGGAGGTLPLSFQPFGSSFTGGVRLAALDLDANGAIDRLAAAPGAGRAPEIRLFNLSAAQVDAFFAYEAAFTGGVFVGGG